VVRRSAPHGKGRAIREGIAASARDVLVFLDADGQDPPRDIARLLEALHPDVDLVNGSKFLGTCRPGAISAVNRAGNQFMSGLINVLFRVHVTDSQSGFRAIRRASLATLTLTAAEYEIETEILLRGLRRGWNVREIPVTRDRREHGRSGFRRIRNGLRILATIVRIRLGRA
jgi:glycosyltransferase involved in cell wall biosynthesis